MTSPMLKKSRKKKLRVVSYLASADVMKLLQCLGSAPFFHFVFFFIKPALFTRWHRCCAVSKYLRQPHVLVNGGIIFIKKYGKLHSDQHPSKSSPSLSVCVFSFNCLHCLLHLSFWHCVLFLRSSLVWHHTFVKGACESMLPR